MRLQVDCGYYINDTLFLDDVLSTREEFNNDKDAIAIMGDFPTLQVNDNLRCMIGGAVCYGSYDTNYINDSSDFLMSSDSFAFTADTGVSLLDGADISDATKKAYGNMQVALFVPPVSLAESGALDYEELDEPIMYIQFNCTPDVYLKYQDTIKANFVENQHQITNVIRAAYLDYMESIAYATADVMDMETVLKPVSTFNYDRMNIDYSENAVKRISNIALMNNVVKTDFDY